LPCRSRLFTLTKEGQPYPKNFALFGIPLGGFSPTLLFLSWPPTASLRPVLSRSTATQQAKICHPERSDGSASAVDLKFLNFKFAISFSSLLLPFLETKRSLPASKKLAPQTVKLCK
jgi:hypothetical protein